MVLATGISLLIFIAAGIYMDRTYCSPEHSIKVLGLAIERRDRETIHEYVDAPALAGSFRRFALESYRRGKSETFTNEFDRLLSPVFDELADGIADATYTPDSVIDLLCGQSLVNATKRGLAGATDKTVDAITENGSPKIKVYGAVSKVLLRCAAGYVLDEADKDENAPKKERNPNDYVNTTQYETHNR